MEIFMEKVSTVGGNSLPRLALPVIVEGRYDKAAILSMFSGVVITTDGFGVFNSREKQALIRKLAEGGVIILTDSDGGGVQIRSYLTGIISKDKIYQLYIPRIEGKERRKRHASKQGLLGVEGVGGDILRELLTPFVAGEDGVCRSEITQAQLFALGLSGRDNSSELRDAFCLRLGLPAGMNAKAFLAAVSIISDIDELTSFVEEISVN